MKLTQEHLALFCLLRAGLWKTTPGDLSPFPLTASRWWNVYRMAVRHTVAGIAWRGLHHLPDAMLPDEALMIHWVAKADNIERKNRRMDTALDRLLRLMHANGLQPVLLKGQGVADFYPLPPMRECGDIDLYFPSREEERKAAKLVQDSGCQVEKQPDGSYRYVWMGVETEHHTRLFDLHSPWLQGYLSSLIRKHGFRPRIASTDPSAAPVLIPSPLPTLLLLNTHLLKHLMGHGIGLRQFCDMARAYHVMHGNYSPEELRDAYRRTGLLKWSTQLHAILTSHLGLPATDLPYPIPDVPVSPRLLHTILYGGNFGQYGNTRGKASSATWERKLHTLLSFWHRREFSGTYARSEAFWTSLNLMIGHLK